MLVLINGSFGVGKTRVARELVRRTPSSVAFDPELVGIALQRPLRWLSPAARGAQDFQNLRLWRRLTVVGARLAQRRYDVVYVPMAVSDRGVLAEMRAGLERGGSRVHHFCLTAPLATIEERLAARGERVGTAPGDWVHRRARECVEAHRGAAFRIYVETRDRSVGEVASDILSRLVGELDQRA